MRVLFITNDFPPKVGGGATTAEVLARGLQQVGVAVQVLTTAPPQGPEPVTDVPVTRVSPFLDYKGIKVVPLAAGALRAALTHRPHRLLALSWTHDGLVALAVSRMLGVPYVVMAHGTEILRHRRRWPVRALMLQVFQGAQAVAANSTFTKRLVEELGIASQRVVVFDPPVMLPDPLPPPSKELEEKYSLQGKRVILTVARLVRRKGHAQVLAAMRRLKEHYHDLVYVITGEGEYRGELERLTRDYGLEGQVRFTGFLPREEVWQLYQRADIYISPSLDDRGDVEGFGTSLVEAGAVGKPVIAGRSGGVADAVLDGKTGVLVDSRNPDEVARALQMLLNDPALRERLGKAARERALTRFAPEAVARKMLSILEGPASTSGGGEVAGYGL